MLRHTDYYASLNWTFFLFILLVGDPSAVPAWLSSNTLLKNHGTNYSFGYIDYTQRDYHSSSLVGSVPTLKGLLLMC